MIYLFETNKQIHALWILYFNAIIIPFYSIGMNYICEINFPFQEYINGSIMMSMSQFSEIGGIFLCDYLINHEKKEIIN